MDAKTCLKNTGAIILLLVLVVTSAAVQADIIYVDVNATGNDDGTSWTDAYNYLQDALDDAASGDEIWVAEGTYYPDEGNSVTDSNRTETFLLVDGAEVYGGFDPTIGDDTWAERDYINNVTILSGDIDNDGVLNDDNSYKVVVCVQCGASTILDGFTITRGYANGSYPRDHGGGMSNVGSSNRVINCIFTGNYAYEKGGGMYNYDASPTVTNCIFTGNYVEFAGGGMFNDVHAYTAVENCTFVANSSAFGGGAMATNGLANVTVKNSLFFMNSTSNPSYETKGGAVFNIYTGATDLTNCTFVGNVAGGGIGGYGGALTTWNSWDTATNCIFWGNWAITAGGEIYVNVQTDLKISYCDIEGGWNGSKVYDPLKYITNGGGNISTNPEFINIFDFSDITIAAGDTDTIKVNDASRYDVNDEIEYDNDGVARKVTDVNTTTDIITFANDALDANSVMGKVIFNWGIGATDVDEDFHLYWDSNCINAGDPNGDYNGQTDIDGEERVSNIVEIGADELQECMSSDANEYDDWLYWERPECWCYQKQCRGDTDSQLEFNKPVGLLDLNLLNAAFGKIDADLAQIPNGICADLDHIAHFNRRVALSDLNILQDYFGEDDQNVPTCDETPIITGPFNFWTD